MQCYSAAILSATLLRYMFMTCQSAIDKLALFSTQAVALKDNFTDLFEFVPEYLNLFVSFNFCRKNFFTVFETICT